MIPLRYVSELLGYKVEWQNDIQSIELINDTHKASIVLYENNYKLDGEKLELESAPIIYKNRAYVPLSFINKILQQDFEITEAGTISIK